MAETMDPENAAFWLPSHFLTDDDDLLSDNRHHHRDASFHNHASFAKHHNFDALSSLDSPVSSTETERGDSSPHDHDDDDFLTDLTRHLAQSSLHDPTTTTINEKPWVFSTSPQSTLTGFGPCSNNRSGFSSNGSPNGPSQVPSPPVTPPAKNDAAWELLYEAAGQVARLKMNSLAAQIHHHQQQSNRGLLAQPRNVSLSSKPHLNSFYDFPPTPQYEEVKRQRSGGNFYCQHHHHNHQQQRRSCGGGPLGLPQTAWPPLRPNHHRQPNNGPPMRAVFLNGPGSGPMQGMKRQSTGTGVFLPRRAGTTTHQPPPPEPRKKPTGCSPVLLPARVVHALNLDLEEMNNGVNVNSQSRFGSGMLSEHDIIMARRNAILEQQRRNAVRNEGAATMVGHEIRLPSDWTY